jgi:hypothetical protein
MNQIVLGAAIPFVIGALTYCLRRFRATFGMLVAFPVLMCLGALWAIAPDLPRFFGFLQLYHKLSIDPRCDIFFWHYSIDKVETDFILFPVLMFLMLAAVTFAAWRELKISEETH